MNEHETHPESLDLRTYLAPLVRRKWVVLAIVVLAAGGTYFLTSRQQKSYDASTELYIEVSDPLASLSSNPNPGQSAPSIQTLATVAQLITSQSTSSGVGKALGKPVSALGTVTATPVTGTSLVTISASSPNANRAALLANTYLSEFLRSRSSSVVTAARRALGAANAALAALPTNSTDVGTQNQRQIQLQSIAQYRQVIRNPAPGAQQVNPALVPKAPSSPKPTRDALFGGIVGLVLGVIAAFCLELMDRRLVDVATVETVFGSEVLAVLPHVRNPTPLADGQRPMVPSEFLEQLRSLTVVLRLAANPDPPRTIMITSTLPQEGKSTVTRDLALVYAGAGERVLVIDCDLRRPSVARLFAVKSERGLVNVLRNETSLADAVVTAVAPEATEASSNGHSAGAGTEAGSAGSVDVLTHGEIRVSPLAMLSSDRMITLLKDAYEAYDIVLIDTSPVLAVADSVPLLEMVDSVLVIARLGQTTRQAATRFRELVARLSDVQFSVIANDRHRQVDDEYGYYGSYGYGDGAGHDKGKWRKRRQKAGMKTPS